jgi:hypothetical protein
MLNEGIYGVMVGLDGNTMVPVPLKDVTSSSRPLDVDRWSEIAHILSR